jgi:SAM-dependent methyltransferase
MEMIGSDLTGKTVLAVCGGDGDEADFLQRQGAIVTMTELSTVGLEAARVRNPALRCLRMDSEMLGFADRTFDWAIVRDGLHHLARPLKGLYELERVCREGFAIVEGQDSWAVRLLVKLGLGEDWDPAGGYVYRFGRRELEKVFSSVQTVSRWNIHTAWLPPGSDAVRHFPEGMQFAEPVLKQSLILRALSSDTGRALLNVAVKCVHIVAGRWGNSLIVVAWKNPQT